MQKLLVYIYKVFKYFIARVLMPIDRLCTFLVLYLNGVKFSTFLSYGIPKVNVSLGGRLIVGENFRMNNRESSNPIGRFKACSLVVEKKAELVIGKNVGISSTAIVCYKSIKIGDNVNIGGNVVIYDTDFHSLDANDRLSPEIDRKNTVNKGVSIGDNVFIGGHSTILKGVSIGDNAIIGACSLVVKDIPANEVWGGNPAIMIKNRNK
ncbi:acyltransferase [Zobellia uliginosa]|uniref:acyltransferase n=1 Tax=Zobellia uliginosa TaxID=143224 RepID=UPI001C0748B1|nr:acyltransferase [Zobellia uliginosa]MBU2947833.1 acyltransferase [Zobellia uliginosa]